MPEPRRVPTHRRLAQRRTRGKRKVEKSAEVLKPHHLSLSCTCVIQSHSSCTSAENADRCEHTSGRYTVSEHSIDRMHKQPAACPAHIGTSSAAQSTLRLALLCALSPQKHSYARSGTVARAPFGSDQRDALPLLSRSLLWQADAAPAHFFVARSLPTLARCAASQAYGSAGCSTPS